MSDTGDPGFRFNYESNPGDAEGAARIDAEAFAAAFVKTFANNVGPLLARELDKAFKRSNAGKNAFSGFNDSLEEAGKRTQRFRQRAQEEFDALSARIEATRRQLSKAGFEPELFASIDAAAKITQANLRQLDLAIEEGRAGDEVFNGVERSLKELGKEAQRQTAQFQSLSKATASALGKEAEKERAAAQQAATRSNLEFKAATARRFQIQQAADAQALAEKRAQDQRLIQSERQTQRTRIEVLRFAFNQIRAIEKGIGSIFSGTARALSAGLGGVSAVASRLTGIFRRSNRDMNDGLRGALIQRESSISRSFRSQSTTINRELREQSVALERFERQANTGVVGALTGRSRLGTALGLGAGIGGGFALFQGLRNGLQVGGDFVQGLAVLQAQLKLTDDQMAAVRQQSIDLGNDIALPGVSALDAAQAIQILAKQFASLGDAALPAAQAAAKGVLQLSRAAGVQAEEAARVVGAAVNIFGVNADKATAIADQVTNALTNAAGVGFNDFADTFTQSASVFNLFVGPAEDATRVTAEFNAAIAVLAKGGLVGSDAGTSLKNFFLQANRGTKDATGAMSDLIARAGETGTAFFDASGNARTFSETVDIIRRGVKGLSDQQRTGVFQKLFGQDSARAAAILVDLGGNFDSLVTKIEEQGAAADIAAAQNVGLRGALDALGSVIETQQIKTYEKYQGVLGKVVLQFANLLNEFFKGVGILGAVRAALLGAGAALGALLAAKAAGEAFQFLAVGLRVVLTPLGLFITSVALLGAGINVLRKRSPEFARALGDIVDLLRGGLGEGLDRVEGLARKFGDTLRTRVLPEVEQLAIGLARRVVPIVNETVDAFQAFVRAVAGGQTSGEGGLVGFAERLGTAVRIAGRYVRDFVQTSVPLIVGFAQSVAGPIETGFKAARDAVGDFARSVQPLIQPAIDGFGDLRTAISNALGGDNVGREKDTQKSLLDRLLPGIESLGLGVARSLGLGVARSLVNIGDDLIAILGPALLRVQSFIADQLSPRNLQRVVQGLAGLVFQIGETLGLIVSDPKFLAALEGIVVAFTAVAGLALAGFAKGIARNLPAIGKGIVKQFQFVLNQVFKDGLDYKKIAGFFVLGIGSALVLASVVSGFRAAFQAPAETAGRRAAVGFGRTFAQGIKSAAFRGNLFAAGFFGGPGEIERLVRRQGQRTQVALEAEFGRINRNLQRLGRDAVAATGPQGRSTLGTFTSRLVTDEDVANARERLGAIEQAVGKVTLSGALLRAQFSESIGATFRGIGTALAGDISTGTGQARQAIGRLGTSLSDAVANLRENLRAAATGLGQALGGTIVAGVGAALSGQQLGTATSGFGRGIGLAGIISSALFAAASVGGGAQGLAVGGIVASIGLVSAAIAKSGQDAEDAKAKIQGYLDILRNTDTAVDRQKQLKDAIEGVLDAADPEALRLLADSGFDITKFADDALKGANNSQTAFEQIATGLGISSDAIAQFRTEASKAGTSDLAGLISDLKGDPGKEFRRSLEQTGVNVNAFIDLIKLLGGEQDSIFAAAQRFGSLEIIDKNAAANAGRARVEVDRFRDSVLGLANVQLTPSGGLGVFTSGELSGSVVDARNNLSAVQQALDSLNQQRTDALNQQIGTVTTQLDAARQAADDALQALLDLLDGNLFSDSQRQLDQLLGSLPDLASSFQAALQGDENTPGINIAEFFNTGEFSTIGGAKLRGILQPFQDQLAKIVSDAIKNGQTDLANNTDIATLKAQIETLDVPQPVKDILLGQINDFLNSGDLQAALDQFTISTQAANDLQDQLDKLNAELPVQVSFDPFQIAQELRKLKTEGLFSGVIPTNAEIAAAQQTAATSGASTPVGLQASNTLNNNGPLVQVNQTFTGASAPRTSTGQVQAGLAVAAIAGGTGPGTPFTTLFG